jgi:deferrochelatase/peroxidase EfeB
MAFICFAADPSRQVARLLARMELEDQLNRYFEHTAGGVYAIPPAPTGEIIGERLLS